MAGILEIRNISKRFGDLLVVDDLSFEVEKGEFFSLLGPSGCGKTTLLRMMGGFESPSSGSIHLGGRDITKLAPQKRPTAMVFQNYALFPHMTVEGNVEYGLKVKKIDKNTRKKKVRELLDLVNLSDQLKKPVVELSGGQQQRVALARAIAVEPEIILFDEPLSNLDAALRESTRTELKRLQRELGITSIYVTHDQEEALSLSDRIAVMRSGKILEIGSARNLYDSPKSAFVASFIGGGNLIRNSDLVTQLTGRSLSENQVLTFKPEDFLPSNESEGVSFTVESSHFLGSKQEVMLKNESSGESARGAFDASLPLNETMWLKLTDDIV